MSAVVSALDSFTSKQNGENGNVEYSWSNNIQEKILQISFQLTRTKDISTLRNIGEKYMSILVKLNHTDKISINFLEIIYKMMLHTRDICEGKGEYELFYELLSRWVEVGLTHYDENFRKKINIIIRKTVDKLVMMDNGEHPYGSWKDMKYILNKLKTVFPNIKITDIDVANHIISLTVKQLKEDSSTEDMPSLCGRWTPRERSKKFGWITHLLAYEYYPEYITTATTKSSKEKAKRKCLENFRKVLSSLNYKLDTVQVNMAGKNWSDIDFEKAVTSITLSRNKKSFEYITKEGYIRGTETDRLLCSSNYKKYVNKCASGKVNIKASRVGLVDMVLDALKIPVYNNTMIPEMIKTQIDVLNLQWDEAGKQIGDLGNMVAMVDTSASMECDGGNPLYSAIGMGIRVAEKSKLGNRVLTFSSYPKWVDLGGPETTFIDKVWTLKHDNQWGMNTNFVSAAQLIADACVENEVKPEDVSDFVLAIFSDMQIDQADNRNSTMSDKIREIYAEAGMRSIYKVPFEPPHILFWNLRSTSGFPDISTSKNITMFSGFSPVLLNNFCNKGADFLKDCTPWCMLVNQLSNKRYSWSKLFIEEVFVKDHVKPSHDKADNDKADHDEAGHAEADHDEADHDKSDNIIMEEVEVIEIPEDSTSHPPTPRPSTPRPSTPKKSGWFW